MLGFLGTPQKAVWLTGASPGAARGPVCRAPRPTCGSCLEYWVVCRSPPRLSHLPVPSSLRAQHVSLLRKPSRERFPHPLSFLIQLIIEMAMLKMCSCFWEPVPRNGNARSSQMSLGNILVIAALASAAHVTSRLSSSNQLPHLEEELWVVRCHLRWEEPTHACWTFWN